MFRFINRALIVLASLLAVPAAASAQASIAGVVKDTSGAVLPGVTVEASSPVLIEKTRSVVSDGSGQYKIVDLRPGTYTVTFTLPGFNTFKREGIELTGSFTAAVNTELKVGSIEETITVTGETPIVDLQSATKQRVMDTTVISQIPTGRVFANLGVLVPGISQTSAPDVGGSLGANMTDLVAHGSKADSQRIMQNGISLGTNGGGRAGAVPNISAFQEVAIDAGAVDASLASGGVRVNFIPREGGNTFKGSGFFGFANGSMQGNNFTERLQGVGLTTPDAVQRIWDFNPGFGGPIQKDKLWFYTTLRHQGAYDYVGGLFYNANANKPNEWKYVPDTSQPAVNAQIWSDAQTRLTWQATPKNKFAATYDMQDINGNWPFGGCNCVRVGSPTTSVEANTARRFPLQRSLQADWTSPLTNRVLLEAVGIQRVERFATDDNGLDLDSRMISVTEQGAFPIAGLTYRAPASYGNTWMWILYYRSAVSYITGAHAFKVGFNGGTGHNDSLSFSHVPYSYRFNNGLPNQITLRANPTLIHTKYQYDVGVYAQDKWTSDRLTLSYGLRFDYFGNTIPENHLGPVPLAPTRDLTFPAQPNLAWKDVSPKLSAVYDLFGTGKTAVKVSLNKYLQGQALTGLATSPSLVNNVVSSTTRGWTDSNKNFIPDCDLLNPLKNSECATDTNTAFGTLGPGATFDPNLLTGWNHRNQNWEFSMGVQHQILPRVSVDVSYFRRWYGNFQVTDNLTVGASDFSPFSITAPTDSRLVDGGGYLISGLYDLNTNKFGQPAQNYNTFSDNFGKQIEHWNGVDFTANARLRGGLLLQGGISTGRTVTDNCEIVAKLPELLISGSTATPAEYCHYVTPFLTQGKFLGAYTIPKVAVLVSGTFQSIPGPELAANFTATSAIVKSSLGRDLSAGANQNVSVNLVTPGALYGERLNQVDFRVGRIFRYGKVRATVNFDLYNAMNLDTVITENSSYASWRQPTSILQARLAKVSVQWDF